MENKELWKEYFQVYPLSEIQDFIKFLYQANLGSAHFIDNQKDNFEFLLKEYDSIEYDENHPLFERISNEYVRVHLEAIKKEHLKIMHYFFMKSVEIKSNKKDFIEALHEVEEGIKEGWIPFDLENWRKEMDEYCKKECPVVSHTSQFRKYYHPHYRLMKSEYIEIFNCLDNLEKQSVIAIEGNSGAGKSTLAHLISEVYGYPIIHMDDFFLQKHQRSENRKCEIGGNIDYERFYEEVVVPITQKKSIHYQIFDCQAMSFNDKKEILFDTSIIVEGCYSMHPYFNDYAELKIFLSISKDLQIKRILKRNGEHMLSRFIDEWIPKENVYFDEFKIRDKADFIIYEE